MRIRFTAALVALALAVAACGGGDGTTTTESSAGEPTAAPTAAPDPTPAPPTATPAPAEPTATPAPEPTPTPEPAPALTLELTGLTPLTEPTHYEAWLIVDESPVSVGTFGDPVAVEFALGDVDPLAATAVVITIETDTDPAPSATHVLGGALVDGSAALSVGDPSAIGVDFSTASGEYILATPTDGTGTAENERSGIWWTFIPRSQSLVLPELPPGWMYEGWQVIDGIAVTTGTFVSQFGEPDAAAPFSGPQPGPPFPGEDFLVNAPDGLSFPRDLRGTEVVISVEPFPDTDPAPFPVIPLRGEVPADAVDHVSYAVANVAGSLPTGVATVG